MEDDKALAGEVVQARADFFFAAGGFSGGEVALDQTCRWVRASPIP